MCSQLGCGSAPVEESSSSDQTLGVGVACWDQIKSHKSRRCVHLTHFLCPKSDNALLACLTESLRAKQGTVHRVTE